MHDGDHQCGSRVRVRAVSFITARCKAERGNFMGDIAKLKLLGLILTSLPKIMVE